jgi:hypothetical protein
MAVRPWFTPGVVSSGYQFAPIGTVREPVRHLPGYSACRERDVLIGAIEEKGDPFKFRNEENDYYAKYLFNFAGWSFVGGPC